MFIAVATAAAFPAKDGLKIILIGLAAICNALRTNLASSREQQPLSPLDAQALS
jgi:hypothetical protein